MSARLYALSFIVSLVSVAALPLVSVFADELGASPLELGLIGGVGSLVYALSAPVAGLLLNRVKWSSAVLASIGGMGLALVACLAVNAPLHLVALNSIFMASMAVFWPAVEAAIASPSEGGDFSKFSVSWSLGAIIGAGLAALLLASPKRPAIATLGLAMLSSSALPLGLRVRVESSAPARPYAMIFEALTSAPAAWATAFTYAAVQGVIFIFYPVYARDFGLGESAAGLALVTLTLLRTATFPLAGSIKAPAPVLGAAGLACLALGALVLPVAPSAPWVVAASLLAGVGTGLSYYAAIVEALSEGGDKGTRAGLFESAIGFGYSAGPLIAGYAAEARFEYAFYSAVALCLATLAPLSYRALRLLGRRRPR